MPANAYHFVSHWCVEGTPTEVFAIIDDAPGLVRWWPAVYLDVRMIEPGDERGIGKVFQLLTRGWLPYRIRWSFRVLAKDPSRRLALEAWGDLDGQGEWTIAADGPQVNVTHDWRVRADKPLLRYLSFLFKLLFAANHRWAMARGEESLRRELARRAAELSRPPATSSGHAG
jgi:hypothetical protein